MPPCRLPPPSAILDEGSYSASHVVDEFAPYSIQINMTGNASPTPLPGSGQTQLPGFGALLDSLPESERVLDHARSPSSSPIPVHANWSSHVAGGRHASARSDCRRTSWHPYAPPTSVRSYSRSESPGSEHSDSGPQPRTARPTYTEEEIYFIWYHRDDLQLPWPQILELFNMHFGVRPRNGVQGIQCRYYRALDIHHVPKSRARDRSMPNEHYGVRHYMPQKYWTWMRPT